MKHVFPRVQIRSSIALSVATILGLSSLTPATHAANFPALPVKATNQSRAAMLAGFDSDREKTEKVVTVEAIRQINQQNDSGLAFAIIQASQAKTSAEATRRFDQAYQNGGAAEFGSRQQTVAVLKFGADTFLKGPAAKEAKGLIDVGDNLTKKVEQLALDPKKSVLRDAPREYVSFAVLGHLDRLPADVRAAILQKVAPRVNVDYAAKEKEIREGRVMNGTASADPRVPTASKAIDQKIFDDQIATVKAQLAVEGEVLNGLIAKENAKEALQQRRDELALESSHQKATIFLASIVLGPVLGAEASDKFVKTATQLSELQTAIKTFGPGGITPDKLIMFTNFVSAGIALVQIFGSQGQQDPTMVALGQIMKQLEAIKAQLERIEGKIDTLTNLVVDGFHQVLDGQANLSNQLKTLQRVVDAHVTDEAQRRALETYIAYVKKDPSVYKLLLACANIWSMDDAGARACKERLALELSDSTIFTALDLPRRPNLLNPEWSNQLLSVKAVEASPASIEQIAIEQFSIPRFLANNPKAFKQMIARNHEAVWAYATTAGIPMRATPPANPEILEVQVRTLIESMRLNSRMRTPEMVKLIDQAVARIDEVRGFLRDASTPAAIGRAWDLVQGSIANFEQVAAGLSNEIRVMPFSEARQRYDNQKLNGKGGMGLDQVDQPFNRQTNAGADSLAPSEFWLAQEMGFGKVSQVYEAGDLRDESVRINPFEMAWPILVTMRTGFTPDPVAIARAVGNDLAPDNLMRSAAPFEVDVHQVKTKSLYNTYGDDEHVILYRAWMNEGRFTVMENGWQVLGQDYIEKVKKDLHEVVSRALRNAVLAQVREWKANTMAVADRTAPAILPNSGLMTNPALAQAFKTLTLRYLFAENLVLTAYQHENRTARCLQWFNAFEPSSVLERVANSFNGTTASSAAEMAQRREGAIKDCQGRELSPALSSERAELMKWRQLIRPEAR